MTGNSYPISVIINPISAQFEAIQHSEVMGILAYEHVGSRFDLRHTFVPRKQRGQGIASVLVTGALDAIRASAGTVTPSCSYVSAFIHAREDYQDLIDQDPFPARPTVHGEPPDLPTISSGSVVELVDVQVDRIVSNRVVLRPWTLDDTDSALTIYQDDGVIRWTRPFIDTVTDRDVMRRRLDDWLQQSSRLPHPQGRWALELVGSGALIGGAALLALQSEEEELLVMSWELAPSAVGKGLAAEAGHALLHYAFRISAAPTVHALVQPDNQRAISTLRRIGMIKVPHVHTHRGAQIHVYAIDREDLHLDAARRSLSLTD